MVAAELNPGQLAAAAAIVAGLTAIGLLAAVADSGLAGRIRPHPTLTGSIADAATILANNLRVLAAPYLLWRLGFARTRIGRHAGDLIILAVVALSTIPVGLALGRWRAQLIPYVPQLPVEWAALAMSVSAWLTARTHAAERRQIITRAAVTAALLLIAAGLETWATPHRLKRSPAHPTAIEAACGSQRPCGRPGVAFATDYAPTRPGRCKVTRSLPLTTFGSARPPAGADRATSTTPGPPQGGATT